MKKRFLSLILVAAALAGLLVCPVTAASNYTFTDIGDSNVAEAAEILHALGVVNGTGGTLFQPGRTLSRAEFCKMAIEVLGRGDEAAQQSGRVIFFDVRPNHWALGYINAAATKPAEDQAALVAGVGNGMFHPDDPITYGSAIAILLRALGYSDADVGVGAQWYSGHLNVANSIGLTEGLSLSGDETITRGQAAILFKNLLFTDVKGTDDPYLTKLGASILDSAIILSVNAESTDGTTGIIKTSAGEYKTDRAPFPSSYEGTRGKLVVDKNQRVLAIQPDDTGKDLATSASEIEATYIEVTDGERIDVDLKTPVYSADKDMTTYESVWADLRVGTQLTFHYSPAGKLEYIYLRGSTAAGSTSMVAKGFVTGTNPFISLTHGVREYSIYKNGAPATVEDIRKYDVAIFDSAAAALQISDLKLTAVYQNAYPNRKTPTQVTVMNQSFEVLPGAVEDLQQFKLGEMVTFLLTTDGRVAGAVSTSDARSTTVGVITAVSGSEITVEPILLDGVKFSGQSSYSAAEASKLMGSLVTVTSGSANHISVSRMVSSSSVNAWNVLEGTVGNRQVSENVKIFEKVGASKLYPVELEDVTCATVPASKLLYVGRDYANRVSTIILDDVTGDHYTYGFLTAAQEETGSFDGEAILNPTVTVRTAGENGAEESTKLFGVTQGVSWNTKGGIIASLDTLNGTQKLAGYVLLDSIRNVPRTAFTEENGRTIVTVNGNIFPVADNVVCYNSAAGIWFESLDEARAFSDDLIIWFDKAPEDGGKVRMVTVGG